MFSSVCGGGRKGAVRVGWRESFDTITTPAASSKGRGDTSAYPLIMTCFLVRLSLGSQDFILSTYRNCVVFSNNTFLAILTPKWRPYVETSEGFGLFNFFPFIGKAYRVEILFSVSFSVN
jgi:hypothetical protein